MTTLNDDMKILSDMFSLYNDSLNSYLTVIGTKKIRNGRSSSSADVAFLQEVANFMCHI